jgi:large repetitive protein
MRLTRVLLLVSLLALIVVPAAWAIRFTDDSYNMPLGTVGQSYSKQFNGAGGCGPALPYQYSLIGGKLPPGLSLSSSGLVSGTPTQAGSFSFWVDLSDQRPPSADWCRPAEAQREFTIKVDGGTPSPPPLSIAQGALSPKATILNAPYSFQFTAQGGGTQTWSLQSGALPGGMHLSSSGLLSGAPTTSGDFSFRVQVADGTRSAAQTYTLTVVPRLTITPQTVPAGEVARPFELRLAASGGKAGYTWSVATGSALPSGLALDSGAGLLSGRPTVAGAFSLKLIVTDALGFTDSVDLKLTLAAKLSITTKALSPARAGHAFRARLGASGGVQPRTWKLVQGFLPAGIRLNKHTGELSGTARRAGRATVVVQVTDALGGVSTARFVLRVRH